MLGTPGSLKISGLREGALSGCGPGPWPVPPKAGQPCQPAAISLKRWVTPRHLPTQLPPLLHLMVFISLGLFASI